MLFAKRRILKNGEHATATVLSCEYRSKVTSNELRDFDYVLEVHTAAGETFEAKVRDKLWIAGLRPKEGEEDVPVCFDPASRETVFDFKGDRRYDVDAMNAHSTELRKETNAMRKQIKDRGGTPPPA